MIWLAQAANSLFIEVLCRHKWDEKRENGEAGSTSAVKQLHQTISTKAL